MFDSIKLRPDNTVQPRNPQRKYLLAVSSDIRSIWLPFGSSSFLPVSWKLGGFCCHTGLARAAGGTGRNLMGSLVPFPRLPPRGVTWKLQNNTSYLRWSQFFFFFYHFAHWNTRSYNFGKLLGVRPIVLYTSRHNLTGIMSLKEMGYGVTCKTCRSSALGWQ